MKQFEIEARQDWPQIAMSVQCPIEGGCGAPIGSMCMERLAGTPKERADFHASRKAAARIAWELGKLGKIEKTDEHIAEDLDKLVSALVPRLSFIKISFTKGDVMAEGPVTLAQGQSTTATIDYFDQNGNIMSPSSTFTPPTVTYSIDNPAFATSVPQSDGQSDLVTYVSAGVANLTATVAGPNGTLTDTETVTCQPAVVATPVLSSIKINFAAPVAAAPAPPAPAVKRG
jgi:hypothetical protein